MPKAGDWTSIHFGSATYDPSVSRLENVRLLFGGGIGTGAFHCKAGTRVYAPIEVERSSNDAVFKGPSITSTTVEDSAGDGVAGECDANRCIDRDYTLATYSSTFTRIAGKPQQVPSCL